VRRIALIPKSAEQIIWERINTLQPRISRLSKGERDAIRYLATSIHPATFVAVLVILDEEFLATDPLARLSTVCLDPVEI
jgi:ABC-type uncharacterized transport system ATPase subunit